MLIWRQASEFVFDQPSGVHQARFAHSGPEKSEGPRSEIRNNSEVRNPKWPRWSTPVESSSRSFGLRVSDLFRTSAFGFRALAQASQTFSRELDATLRGE